MAGGEMRDFPINEFEELVRTYSRIAKTRLVDVRLERINHDKFRKFHRDFVRTRLLTTYRGPSTACYAGDARAEIFQRTDRRTGTL